MNDFGIISLAVSLIVGGILLPICGYLARQVVDNRTDIAVMKTKLQDVKDALEKISQSLQ